MKYKTDDDNVGFNKQYGLDDIFGRRVRFKTRGMDSKEYAWSQSSAASKRPTIQIANKVEYAIVMKGLKEYTPYDTPVGTILCKEVGNYVYTYEYLGYFNFRIIGRDAIPDAVTDIFERDSYE